MYTCKWITSAKLELEHKRLTSLCIYLKAVISSEHIMFLNYAYYARLICCMLWIGPINSLGIMSRDSLLLKCNGLSTDIGY